MKILILTFSFYPYSTVSAFRITRFAKYLPDYGIEPYIVTARHGSSNDLSAKQGIKTDKIDCNHRHRFPNTFYKKTFFSYNFDSPINPTKFRIKSNFITYSLNYLIRLAKDIFLSPDKHILWSLSIIPTAYRLIKRQKINTLLITGDPFSLFVAGVIIKKLTGVKLILDYRDPWLSNRMNLMQTVVRRFINARYQNLCLQNSDLVVSVNSYILADLPVADNKKLNLPNGFDPELFEGTSDNVAHQEKNDSKDFIFLYAGKMDIHSTHYNPITFLEAYQLFRDRYPGVVTKVVMFGKVTPITKESLQRAGLLDSVELKGEVSPQEVIMSGYNADALIVFLYPEKCTDRIASKIFEYLKLKKPIVCINSTDGVIAELLKEINAGYSCVNDDRESIVKLLNKVYLLDKELFRQQLNDHLIESFNAKLQVKKLAAAIFNLHNL